MDDAPRDGDVVERPGDHCRKRHWILVPVHAKNIAPLSRPLETTDGSWEDVQVGRSCSGGPLRSWLGKAILRLDEKDD